MSLKSIKENYTSLLKTFAEAGVKLNESQKGNLDNFMTDLEETMKTSRDNTIRMTAKMVEEKLENEYKGVVESILKHQKEHSELAGKIQNKVHEVNESKYYADAVDQYLEEYVEEVLPKKTIVDYNRMQKLEKIQESLKEMLLVSDLDVQNKVDEIKESLVKESAGLKAEVERYKKFFDGNAKTLESLTKEISILKAKDFVNESVKDLPEVESKMVLEKTKGMGYQEVQKNMKNILESVKTEVAEEKVVTEDNKNLEEAITEILNGKKEEASTETNSDKDAEGQEVVPQAEKTNEEPTAKESVVVTESQMQSWIDTLNRITPKK